MYKKMTRDDFAKMSPEEFYKYLDGRIARIDKESDFLFFRLAPGLLLAGIIGVIIGRTFFFPI